MDPAMMGGPPMDPAMMGAEGAPPEEGEAMQAEMDEVKTTLQSLIDGQTAILEVLTSIMQPAGSEEGPSAAPSPGKLAALLGTKKTLSAIEDEEDLNAINRIQNELRL